MWWERGKCLVCIVIVDNREIKLRVNTRVKSYYNSSCSGFICCKTIGQSVRKFGGQL